MTIDDKFFEQFCIDRNIKFSTRKGYESAISLYVKVHRKSLSDLLDEARSDEDKNLVLKNRRIKRRLLKFRNFLLDSDLSANTCKTYFQKVKTFYLHFEVELPYIPPASYERDYMINYDDLPSHDDIRNAVNSVGLDLKAVILFMSSSGTAKAETLSLTVGDFLEATREYHRGGGIVEVLDFLRGRGDVVPTFYLRRIKTDKWYYTFCSPEACRAIVDYLLTREGLCREDRLFDFTPSRLLLRFQEINDRMGWGFKGKYRFFRSHALRKFHASNIGLSAEYVDSLQGRSKNSVHETYIKTNPKRLKEVYMGVMGNVMLFGDSVDDGVCVVNQEFTIVVNVFCSGKEFNVL